MTSVRLRAASTVSGSGKSSGASGRSSGRCEKSCPPKRPDSRLRPTSGSVSSLTSRARRCASASVAADHRAQARQDQHLLRRPPFGRRQPLQIGIEFLRGRLRHMGGEHGLGMPRGEAAAGVGRARLHQHRPALRAARHVERARRPGKEIAAMIDRPDALTPRVDAAGAVVEHRIGRPAVPQRRSPPP